MITFEWHLLIYIIVNAFVFVWAITRDGTEGYLGSDRGWAFIIFLLIAILSTAIYDGIYWW